MESFFEKDFERGRKCANEKMGHGRSIVQAAALCERGSVETGQQTVSQHTQGYAAVAIMDINGRPYGGWIVSVVD